MFRKISSLLSLVERKHLGFPTHNQLCKMTSSLSQSNQEKVVNTWIDILKIPVIAGGRYSEDENVFNIQSYWSVKDVTKKESVTFSKTFTVLKNSFTWPNDDNAVVEPVVISSKPVTEECKISSYSPTGLKRAVVVEKSGDEAGQPKRELLQIWDDNTLLKTYDLNELDKHKGIITAAGFCCKMAWNKDETKLAYLAEKKLAKSKPYFTSYSESCVNAPKTKENDETPIKGEEYVLKQTWGEQLNDNHLSVIVVLDVTTDAFNVLDLSKDDFPMDIQWAGDSIVATSVIIPIWRLGFIFCSNRETRIFKIDADGKNFEYLSPPGRGASSPRVRPDGNYVVWQERAVDEPQPHRRATAIMGYDLLKKDGPVILYGPEPENGVPIYEEFSKECWSPDSTKLYVLTPSEAAVAIVILSLNEEPKVIRPEGLNGILWIGNEHMLIACSSLLDSPTLQLMCVKNEKFQRAYITKPTSFTDRKMMIKHFTGERSPPSIFIGPDATCETITSKSVPLIVWPHGGPHSVFTNMFMMRVAYFLKSGYAILLLNYIGSIGGKKDVTDELLGFIGQKDVQDCQMVTEQVINALPFIDKDKVVVQGGSHGGYLTAQLITNYPEFYKAAVLLNPVIDLNSLVATTDITDWVLAESGVKGDSTLKTVLPYATNLQDAKTFQLHSPIMNADKVKTPALLLLGSEDLRVPMCQGLAFYRALLAHGKKTDVRIYKDCHSLAKVAVDTDSIINSALWFLEGLNYNGNNSEN